MKAIVVLKKALYKLEQNNFGLIFLFLLGYLLFTFYYKYKNSLSEEEKARRFRKSIKYLNKHQKENEDFFFGVVSETEYSNNS